MNSLIFGSRKRLQVKRRAAFRRAALGTWIVAAVGATLGLLPGPTAGTEFLEDLLANRRVPLVSAGVSTSDSARSAMKFRHGVFEKRPAPTASPTVTASEAAVPVAPSGGIQEIIYAAAAEYGLDGAYLLSIAGCESGLDPGAVNAAGYHGLFQYDQTTWSEYGYGSIYDPVAQARTTAMLISQGQSGRWPNCA